TRNIVACCSPGASPIKLANSEGGNFPTASRNPTKSRRRIASSSFVCITCIFAPGRYPHFRNLLIAPSCSATAPRYGAASGVCTVRNDDALFGCGIFFLTSVLPIRKPVDLWGGQDV